MRIQDRILDITNNTYGYTINETDLTCREKIMYLSFYFEIHTE